MSAIFICEPTASQDNVLVAAVPSGHLLDATIPDPFRAPPSSSTSAAVALPR